MSTTHPFYDKTVVISGSLDKAHNKKVAADMIASVGGLFSGKVTTSTDFVVNARQRPPDHHATNVRKAEEWEIPVLDESEFWEQLGDTPPPEKWRKRRQTT